MEWIIQLDLDLFRIWFVLVLYSTFLHQHWLVSDGSHFKGHLTMTFKHICYRKICISFCTEALQSEVFCFLLFLQQSDSADTYYFKFFPLKKPKSTTKHTNQKKEWSSIKLHQCYDQNIYISVLPKWRWEEEISHIFLFRPHMGTYTNTTPPHPSALSLIGGKHSSTFPATWAGKAQVTSQRLVSKMKSC